MEDEITGIDEIDNEINNLKAKKKKIKQQQDKSLRLRSNNAGKSNVNQRVSNNFNKILDSINKKRDENGNDLLSYPKITELIIKHKKGWPMIKRDIINYNTIIDSDEEVEFNDK